MSAAKAARWVFHLALKRRGYQPYRLFRVSFEWHEHDNIGALTLGTTVGMLSEKDQQQYKAVKAIDPLF